MEFATPGNTLGMGNVSAPGENGELGSGDIITNQPVKKKKKKKFQSLKDYLKKHRVG